MSNLALNRNEQLYGPSPECFDVLKNFDPEHAYRYIDDYYNSLLRPKLSEVFGISERQIITGYGAEDILRIIFNTLEVGTSVLTHEFHFSYYKKYLDSREVSVRVFRMNDGGNVFSFDIDDCLSQYDKLLPKVILITSPNGHTGNALTAEDLKRILEHASGDTLVIADEVFWGFDEDYDQAGFFSLLHEYPNFMIVRSFSKLYGLAGLRIGFAFCGDNVKSMLRYQNHYLGMSRILEEVAIAALGSADYYRNISRKVIAERERLRQRINETANFRAYESRGSSVAVKLQDSRVDNLKLAWDQAEVVTGKFVAPSLVRLSVGLPEHNDATVALLHRLDSDT